MGAALRAEGELPWVAAVVEQSEPDVTVATAGRGGDAGRPALVLTVIIA